MTLIREKKLSEYMIVEFNEHRNQLKVIQNKTGHLKKMGFHDGEDRLLDVEECIYLVKIGAAIVISPESRNPLALSQLMSLLPRFQSDVFRYSALSALYRKGLIVKRIQGKPLFQIFKLPKTKCDYLLVFKSDYENFFENAREVSAEHCNVPILIPSATATGPRFEVVESYSEALKLPENLEIK